MQLNKPHYATRLELTFQETQELYADLEWLLEDEDPDKSPTPVLHRLLDLLEAYVDEAP